MNRTNRPAPRQAAPVDGPRRESATTRGARASRVVARLRKSFPAARCSLDFESPFQLLIATILSAQCTDRRVNMVTPGLFRRWPDAAALASAGLRDLEAAVRSTGFFRAKARSIRGCAFALVDRHGGEVPRSMEDLVALPGVGRKTANVVLGSGFGIPTGVVVDTHVGRIARRLGLTGSTDPVRVERDLMRLLRPGEWIGFSHRVIALGRGACAARRPACGSCPLADLCPRVGVKPG